MLGIIPYELIKFDIITKLSILSISLISKTCKKLKLILENEELWKMLYLRDFGIFSSDISSWSDKYIREFSYFLNVKEIYTLSLIKEKLWEEIYNALIQILEKEMQKIKERVMDKTSFMTDYNSEMILDTKIEKYGFQLVTMGYKPCLVDDKMNKLITESLLIKSYY